MQPIFLLMLFIGKSQALLPFPRGTTNGYIVALALPIDLPNRNLYMSNNLEANYVLPSSSTDFTQGFYDKILFADGVEEDEETARKQKSLSLFSRQIVYQMIERKVSDFGFNGRACLLRIICDVASSNFYEINGVLGDIFHVILTPSTSVMENETEEYLEAEIAKNNCTSYAAKCDVDILDALSAIV